MKKNLLVVSICLLFLRIPFWGIPAQTTTEHEIVAQVIRANIGWALTKDRPLLESTMIRDGRLFIFNPDSESTAGWEQFEKNFSFWMDPRFKATGSEIRELRIDFSPAGDTAWWSCILDDLYEWDGKAGAWKDTRWTGVLEKRGGKWRIVQMHFSFAADKVAAAVKEKLARKDQGTGNPLYAGPYLGQKPPGMTPELFAPGIVSTGLDELNSVFSPDGREFYYCVRNIQGAASIFQVKLENGVWSPPRLLPCASRFGDIDASVSPAGDALLFSSLRPLPGESALRRDNDFWMAPKQGDAWGEAVHLGPAVNSPSHDYYPFMTRSGALYFSSQREGPGANDIFRSEQVDGVYTAAVKLGAAVNTSEREFDPYVSPAEDLLIFASNRPGGLGSSDLYVCFRTADGSWTPAVNLGAAVNSPGPEFSPALTPDGRYLFFTSYRFQQGRTTEAPVDMADFVKTHNLPGNGLGDIYWVDARTIEGLRPK